jgi:hypothetical protein
MSGDYLNGYLTPSYPVSPQIELLAEPRGRVQGSAILPQLVVSLCAPSLP